MSLPFNAIVIDTCPKSHQKITEMDIEGKDLGNAKVEDSAKCCALCAKTPDCVAYVFSPEKGLCLFKSADYPTTRKTALARETGSFVGILNIVNDGTAIQFIYAIMHFYRQLPCNV